MATYLLTWNPEHWSWDEFPQMLADNQAGKEIEHRWSIGNRKNAKLGSRVFLYRQSTHHGLLGAGYTTTEPFEDAHWGESEKRARYVMCRFDTLISPHEVLPVEKLYKANLNVAWNQLLASGV